MILNQNHNSKETISNRNFIPIFLNIPFNYTQR